MGLAGFVSLRVYVNNYRYDFEVLLYIYMRLYLYIRIMGPYYWYFLRRLQYASGCWEDCKEQEPDVEHAEQAGCEAESQLSNGQVRC